MDEEHQRLVALEAAARVDIHAYGECPLEDKAHGARLSAAIQGRLAQIRGLTRDLDLLVEELDSDEERAGVASLLARHKAEYASLQGALKEAALAQRAVAMRSAAEQRRELLAGTDPLARQRALATEAGAVAASEGVTEGLRRTRAVLAEELSHTAATLAAMETSHATLGATRDEHGRQHGHLRKSKGLLAALSWQNRSEAVMLWGGLLLFMTVVAYVATKRAGYFVPEPLRPAALLQRTGLPAYLRAALQRAPAATPAGPLAGARGAGGAAVPPLAQQVQRSEWEEVGRGEWDDEQALPAPRGSAADEDSPAEHGQPAEGGWEQQAEPPAPAEESSREAELEEEPLHVGSGAQADEPEPEQQAEESEQEAEEKRPPLAAEGEQAAETEQLSPAAGDLQPAPDTTEQQPADEGQPGKGGESEAPGEQPAEQEGEAAALPEVERPAPEAPTQQPADYEGELLAEFEAEDLARAVFGEQGAEREDEEEAPEEEEPLWREGEALPPADESPFIGGGGEEAAEPPAVVAEQDEGPVQQPQGEEDGPVQQQQGEEEASQRQQQGKEEEEAVELTDESLPAEEPEQPEEEPALHDEL
eukprot:scaffold8.g1434.t1